MIFGASVGTAAVSKADNSVKRRNQIGRRAIILEKHKLNRHSDTHRVTVTDLPGMNRRVQRIPWFGLIAHAVLGRGMSVRSGRFIGGDQEAVNRTARHELVQTFDRTIGQHECRMQRLP
jgi:hypothetical protein